MEQIIVQPVAITQPLVDFIPDSEGILSYCARVSNPANQCNFDTADKLLNYCANEGHWSVFEMVNIVLHVKAPRDISRQILRHRSGAFQEFSQRYAEVQNDMFTVRETRMQDTKNRQNSFVCEDQALIAEWENRQRQVIDLVVSNYQWALNNGIAKESARVILPEGNTMSSMFVNLNVRSLVHWINVRRGNGTQKEHTDVALKALEACRPYFPLSWKAFYDA